MAPRCCCFFGRGRREPLLDPEERQNLASRLEGGVPERQASCCSFILLAWFSPIINLAFQRNAAGLKLLSEDLYPLDDRDRAELQRQRLAVEWQKELSEQDPSLLRALRRAFLGEVLTTGLIKLAYDLVHFVNPFLLSKIIAEIRFHQGPHRMAYVCAVAMVVTSFTDAVLNAHYTRRGSRTGMRVRAALIMLVYDKSLRTLPWASAAARRELRAESRCVRLLRWLGGSDGKGKGKGKGEALDVTASPVDKGKGKGEGQAVAGGELEFAPASPNMSKGKGKAMSDGNGTGNAEGKGSLRDVGGKAGGKSGKAAGKGGKGGKGGDSAFGGSGTVTNLVSADTDKFTFLMPFLNLVWSAPLQLIICFTMLAYYVSWAALAGIAVMLLMISASSALQSRSRRVQAEAMKAKDARLKMQTQLLKIIKIIKLYAWETAIEERVCELRDAELSKQLRYKLWNIGIFISFSLSPTLVSLATFATYTAVLGHSLDASIAFPALSLFGLLNLPLSLLPILARFLAEATVSAGRIEAFLLAPEVPAAPPAPADAGLVVDLRAARLAWPDGTDLLRDVRLQIRRGEFVVIIGKTGAGKTGLLQAMLGELPIDPKDGQLASSGSVGYCAQTPWLRNALLRDNIRGDQLDIAADARYQAVLDSCALAPDLLTLPGGDLTMIGDRGINLSGGQKQRVALCRAVYPDPDVLVLDDVLSALDAHVSAHVCSSLLRGPLTQGKTVILVTHSQRALSLADRVVALGEGRIAFDGSYASFCASGLASEIDVALGAGDASPRSEASDSAAAVPEEAAAKVGGGGETKASQTTPSPSAATPTATGAEETRSGKVECSTYVAYAKACGGLLCLGPYFLTLVGIEGSKNLSDAWLSRWSDKGGDAADGLEIYALLALVALVAGVLWVLGRALVGQKASRTLHQQCQHALLRARMSFYDQTPMGQILNRLAEDTNILDYNLPMTWGMYMMWTWRACAIVVVCMTVGWYLLIIMVPMFVVYSRVSRRYLPATRDLRRLDAAARSPIIGHFGETISGASTIRAMRMQASSTAVQIARLERQMEAYYLAQVAPRWLSLRLNANGAVFTGSVSSLAVYFGGQHVITASVAGLAITYSLRFTDTLSMLNTNAADLETQMVSVERVQQYVTSLEQEAPLYLPDMQVPADWPSVGSLRLSEVSARYRPELPLVLNSLSLEIKGGERVGIVGRTGCGKSSLLMVLMRIVEPEAGRMTIDGFDVRALGLHSLRSRVAIIPQEPTILSGTIRFNLDPLRLKSDCELWDALEKAELRPRVEAAGGLDSHVEDGGGNYSVGELQLLCLARAILRRLPAGGLLLLDEATSSLDHATDVLVQRVIRSEFKCTTVTIAHRVQTLLDYDRIAVLEAGSVVELGSPQELLAQPSSQFFRLAAQAGVSLPLPVPPSAAEV